MATQFVIEGEADGRGVTFSCPSHIIIEKPMPPAKCDVEEADDVGNEDAAPDVGEASDDSAGSVVTNPEVSSNSESEISDTSSSSSEPTKHKKKRKVAPAAPGGPGAPGGQPGGPGSPPRRPRRPARRPGRLNIAHRAGSSERPQSSSQALAKCLFLYLQQRRIQ